MAYNIWWSHPGRQGATAGRGSSRASPTAVGEIKGRPIPLRKNSTPPMSPGEVARVLGVKLAEMRSLLLAPAKANRIAR
jgi:hypothetical protein